MFIKHYAKLNIKFQNQVITNITHYQSVIGSFVEMITESGKTHIRLVADLPDTLKKIIHTTEEK